MAFREFWFYFCYWNYLAEEVFAPNELQYQVYEQKIHVKLGLVPMLSAVCLNFSLLIASTTISLTIVLKMLEGPNLVEVSIACLFLVKSFRFSYFLLVKVPLPFNLKTAADSKHPPLSNI